MKKKITYYSNALRYGQPSIAERLVNPKKIKIGVVKKNQGAEKLMDEVRRRGYPGANFIK